MKITFLGTGTSQGVPIITCKCNVCASIDSKDKRLRTSVFIEYKNTNIVIDTGPDFRTQMLKENVNKIDAVFLTHSHHDHIAGLDDIRAFNYSQKMAIPIYANNDTLNKIKSYYFYAFGENKYPGSPNLNLIEINENPFIINKIKVIPINVKHGNLDVLGYRIDDFAYITDSSYISDKSLDKLKNLNILIINGLHFKNHHSHFTIDESIEVIKKLKPEKAYITHISHNAGRYDELIKKMPKNIFIAYDGLSIEL